MPKAKTRIRLSHAAAVGIKELPSNTAWLIGKAWHPATERDPGKDEPPRYARVGS